MAQTGGEGLAAVFPFCLGDQDLVDGYLRPRIAGQPLPRHVTFIHDVDLYSTAPEKLVVDREAAPGTGAGDKRVWYFYSTVRYAGKNARGGGGGRKSRTVGAKERWHAETALKPVAGAGAGGKFQKFSYQVASAVGGYKPGGWLMTEYSIDGGGDLVLCKVYKSPRAPPSESSSSSSSSCTTMLTALPGSGCKRKAAAGDHPEARPTARRQTDEEEHGVLFADAVERAPSASSGELGLDDGAASKNYGTHVLLGGEPPLCAWHAETEDSLQGGDQLMSKNGDTMAMPIVIDDDDDVDSFGGGLVLCRSPRSASSSCTTTASLPVSGCYSMAAAKTVRQQSYHDEEDALRFWFSSGDATPVLDHFDVLASSSEEGGELTLPQCTPGDAGPGPGTHGEKVVFEFDDAGVSVDDLLDLALGERDGGLSCPAPRGEKLFTFTASSSTILEILDSGRYKVLSTYLPTPCSVEEDDEALRWSEAAGTSRLFAGSAVDAFWGTPDGIWIC